MDVQRLNISLLPPAVVATAIRSLASSLPPEGQLFNVAEPTRLPHVTLYMSMFPARNLYALEQRISQAISWLTVPQLRCQALAVTQGGYVEIGYRRTWALRQLQVDVIAATCDLRDTATASRSDHSRVSAGKKENLKAYGYALLGGYFRPHATLARYGLPPQLDAFEFDQANFDWRGTTLAISVADEYGSAVQKLSEVEIS